MKCPRCHADNPETLKFCGECGTQLPLFQGHQPVMTETLQTPVHELTSGTIFAGRYQVIEELGHGGMGRVYKVLDTKTREKVALKLIKPEIASDRETIERFGNELRLARKIRQKNVCGMYDLGEAEGAHFITMEYVYGEDLKSMIQMAGSLNVGTVLSIGKQICDGLAEAHGLGVVHRDLKPQNIMIDRGGNAKIMDFGIARSLKEKGITGASVMIGTPEYMSPEQAEAKEVDQRSDIYSLGIILYEMATGKVPFEGDTALSIAMKHKGETPKDPKQLNPGIPIDLSGVILKCLAKDKEKRYQTAGELRSELDKIERGIPTTERVVPVTRAGTSRQVTVSFNPRKLVVPGLVTLVLIAALVVVLSVLPRKSPVPSPSARPTIAIVNFENKTGDKSLDKWSTGIRDLLITDLNQSKFLAVLSDSDIYGILKKLNLADASVYSTGDLVRIADEGGAQYTINGSFLKAGDQIIINATCQKPHLRAVISPVQVTGRNFDEIMAKIHEITQKVKTDLNLSPTQLAGDVDKSLGEISTPSSEAWAYYAESRKYHFRNEYAKAIPLLQKAIAIDPEFIMAYRALGSAYYNNYDWPEARKYEAKSFELIQKHPERISEKDRYFIEQNYYVFNRPEQDWGKAIEAGRKSLALYPDEANINYGMGVVYNSIEEWDEALKYFEKCVAARYHFEAAYSSMADTYSAKDMPVQGQEVLEKYLRDIENTAIGHRDLAYLHLSQDRLDLGGRELDAAQTLGPNDFENRHLSGILNLYKGDLAQAEAEFRSLLGEKIPRARYYGYAGLKEVFLLKGRYGAFKELFTPLIEQTRNSKAGEAEWYCRNALAHFSLSAGRPETALNECRKAYAVDAGRYDFQDKRESLHLQGFAYLALKRIGEAEKTAGELKAFIEKGLNKKIIRLYDHLMGAIELERNDFSRAIEYLERAERALPYGRYEKDAWILDTLALAHFRAGDLEKACEEYGEITALTSGRLDYGDIYAKAFYMLGQIYEKQGDKVKAREHYQKFLDLWKDADPGLPGVEDAKKRLAGLQGS